jgi:predicted RNA-binding Zn ribbon-like protein
METPDRIGQLKVVGGNVALDFVNTRGGDPDPPPGDEAIRDYADLVAWASHVGLFAETDADHLCDLAARGPVGAADAYARALRLRTVLDALFRSLAQDLAPPDGHLRALQAEASEALGHARLVEGEGAYRWTWQDPDDLERPLWPVVHAAVELLTGGPLDRVKKCSRCRWLFLDESKNRSRRWCSMGDCGTAEKVSRYVARRAAARG